VVIASVVAIIARREAHVPFDIHFMEAPDIFEFAGSGFHVEL
jgi:hypothetical protein